MKNSGHANARNSACRSQSGGKTRVSGVKSAKRETWDKDNAWQNSYFKTELLKLPQCFCIPSRIVHRVVRVRSNSKLLPLSGFGSIFDQSGVEISNSAARKT